MNYAAFFAHPENFFWGRLMLLCLFGLAFAVPLLIVFLTERRTRRGIEKREVGTVVIRK